MNLDLVVSVPHLPARGETVLGCDVVYRSGGKGANQAVAARRLGVDVSLFAASGDDRFAADLRSSLDAEGVDLTRVVTSAQAPTGLALIVVRPDGEGTITVAQGANRLLEPANLDGLAPDLASSDVLLLQLEVPVTTALAAARTARDTGTPAMLNAAPLLGSARDDALIRELLATVDVLVVNETEAEQLGGARYDDLVGWTDGAASLREHGPSLVVITLGDRGAVAATADQRAAHGPFVVESVDSTGAGDAFCGALAVGLAEGMALDPVLRRACAAGALATTQVGAQSSFASRAELEAFLDRADVGRSELNAS